MEVSLYYGKDRLVVSFPDNLAVDVIKSRFAETLKGQRAAVTRALQNPVGAPLLRELAGSARKACIVFNDITRPTPYRQILSPLLAELSEVPGGQIVLLNATGTHRPNTDDELRTILGAEIVSNYRIVQNDASDPASHLSVGITRSGNNIRVHREYVESDLRILTGFIEPHFFAGFSGGAKACMPGVAQLDTILANHGAKHIDDPCARWAITKGNPVWEEICEAVDLAGQAFLLNVALNPNGGVTAVFAGDVHEAHARGCRFVKAHSVVPVETDYDIVVTSNSGHPLDLNMYQCVKGLSAASQIVRKGGAIVMAGSCWDGIPEHGLYAQLLRESDSPVSMLKRIRTPGFVARDAWQAHIHCLICCKAEVYFYSDNLSDEQIRSAFFEPCRDITNTVERLATTYGRSARVCVLPEGPRMVPYRRCSERNT